MGGEWEGEKEPERSWWTVGDSRSEQKSRRLFSDGRADVSGRGADWHGWRQGCGGSVEEVGCSAGPGTPDVTDLSRHGQARRLRRSPWSHTADKVNHRRHFSL